MKRKVLTAILAVACVASITACGKDKQGDPNITSTGIVAQITDAEGNTIEIAEGQWAPYGMTLSTIATYDADILDEMSNADLINYSKVDGYDVKIFMGIKHVDKTTVLAFSGQGVEDKNNYMIYVNIENNKVVETSTADYDVAWQEIMQSTEGNSSVNVDLNTYVPHHSNSEDNDYTLTLEEMYENSGTETTEPTESTESTESVDNTDESMVDTPFDNNSSASIEEVENIANDTPVDTADSTTATATEETTETTDAE